MNLLEKTNSLLKTDYTKLDRTLFVSHKFAKQLFGDRVIKSSFSNGKDHPLWESYLETIVSLTDDELFESIDHTVTELLRDRKFAKFGFKRKLSGFHKKLIYWYNPFPILEPMHDFLIDLGYTAQYEERVVGSKFVYLNYKCASRYEIELNSVHDTIFPSYGFKSQKGVDRLKYIDVQSRLTSCYPIYENFVDNLKNEILKRNVKIMELLNPIIIKEIKLNETGNN